MQNGIYYFTNFQLILLFQNVLFFLAGCVASQKGDHTMATSNKNLHLTDDERRIIQCGIENNSSKKSIADTLGKDKSTIGKEIKNHRTLSYKSKYPVECIDAGKCPNKYSHHCSRNVLPSSLSSVKDGTVLLVHATAVKDTIAAGSTSTSMKRMLHRKNMLNCSVMHVQVSMLRAMKSEI